MGFLTQFVALPGVVALLAHATLATIAAYLLTKTRWKAASNAEIVAATQELDADEIADLAPDLPEGVVQDIIEAQGVEDRAQLQTALSYGEGTVGSLMDFEVVSIPEDVDCEAALYASL